MNVALQRLLDLLQLQRGLPTGLPCLPQLRIPAGQMLLQFSQSRFELLTQGLQLLLVFSLLCRLAQVVSALQIALRAPQLLKIADRSLQLPLLLGICQQSNLCFLMHLMKLQ